MNPRERILAISVAAVLVLAGLVTIVRLGVVQRWQTLQDGRGAALAEQKKLRDRLADARRAEQRWGDLKPLAHNPDVGEDRLRRDISQMIDQYGLAEVCTIRALPPRKLKNTFTEVRLSIQTRGTLKQVLDFLCDFYRRQYLIRLDQVSLTAEDPGRRGRVVTRGGRPGSRAGTAADVRATPPDPEGPRLNISMQVTALVLPEASIGGKKIEQPPIADTVPPPDSLGRLPRPRAEYQAVLAQNVMKEWVKPEDRPIVQAPTSRPDAGSSSPPPPPPVQRPNKKLAGVTSTDGKLEAHIRDVDRKELPLEVAGINDPVDDGVLVLVYPRGMVVQVAAQNAEDTEYKYYVYKLGETFAQRVELDPQQYPELAEQLELALAPSEDVPEQP